MPLKTVMARRAVKATARHSAHGTASKLRRRPLRTVTLLAVGALLGALVAWSVARAGAGQGEPEPAGPAGGPR